jgi:hypothetical protein
MYLSCAKGKFFYIFSRAMSNYGRSLIFLIVAMVESVGRRGKMNGKIMVWPIVLSMTGRHFRCSATSNLVGNRRQRNKG